MKAVVNTEYGSPNVLQVRRMPKPEPKADEILVKVRATTVSRTDCGMLEPHPFFIRLTAGLLRPKLNILGMDFAGTVQAVGGEVTSFTPGDRVFGMSPDRFGAHAEFICLPQDGQIAAMPAGCGFEEVVLCEGAWYADTCLKGLGLRPGHRILIYGASGAIGIAAVQLAKAYGAEVTAVVATRHLGLARSLGADRVIDYTAGDFTRFGEVHDCVLDAVGKTTFFSCRRLLTPKGRFAATDLGPWWQNIWLSVWFSIVGSRRVSIPFPKVRQGFVDSLGRLLKAREVRAVVDRTVSLEAIADGYRYVRTGQKTGIVVVTVQSSEDKAN